jgi:hypothetical protein
MILKKKPFTPRATNRECQLSRSRLVDLTSCRFASLLIVTQFVTGRRSIIADKSASCDRETAHCNGRSMVGQSLLARLAV